MAFGLLPSGFKAKRLADIRQELRNDLQAALGGSIDVSGGSVLGVLIGVLAQGLALCWSELRKVSDSRSPLTADEDSLVDFGLQKGLTIRGPSRLVTNMIQIQNTDSNTHTLLAGKILTVTDSMGVEFDLELLNNVTIGANSIEFGIWEADSNGKHTIQQNEINITDGDFVFTNPVEIIGGSNGETIDEFRLRVLDTNAPNGAGTDNAVRSRLLSLPFIQQARVVSNRSGYALSNGQPGKSFRPIVLPIGYNALTSNQALTIAETILKYQTQGIESWGQVTHSLVDDSGVTDVIKFDVADVVDIHVQITFDGKQGDVDEDAIKQTIIESTGFQRIGSNVYASKLNCGPVNTTNVDIISIKVSDGNGPFSDFVVIEDDEVARFLDQNIGFVYVQ